ncbi:MAG: glycosyltransferase [Candidatus Hatepunaea meridiana]|nr:glycosyltransferase [Candidatus Hatepunaea meridiana]
MKDQNKTGLHNLQPKSWEGEKPTRNSASSKNGVNGSLRFNPPKNDANEKLINSSEKPSVSKSSKLADNSVGKDSNETKMDNKTTDIKSSIHLYKSTNAYNSKPLPGWFKEEPNHQPEKYITPNSLKSTTETKTNDKTTDIENSIHPFKSTEDDDSKHLPGWLKAEPNYQPPKYKTPTGLESTADLKSAPLTTTKIDTSKYLPNINITPGGLKSTADFKPAPTTVALPEPRRPLPTSPDLPITNIKVVKEQTQTVKLHQVITPDATPKVVTPDTTSDIMPEIKKAEEIVKAVEPKPLPPVSDQPKPPFKRKPVVEPEQEVAEEEIDEEAGQLSEEANHKEWGYGFVLVILVTIFGSITIATYFVLLRQNFSIPNIIVNVSVISLLIFLLAVIFRYFVLIFFSFLHTAQTRTIDEVKRTFSIPMASVMVPAYNEGVVIDKSIESLLKLSYPNYEVIVIDDGSTDDTLEKARKWEGMHGSIRVTVLTQKNAGKANALNYGIREAIGEVVVCMDGDSKLTEGTLNAGMRHFDDPKIAAVAGNVKVINRQKLVTKLQTLEYIEGLNLVRRAQAFFHVVNIVPGPMGFFRRSAILEVGGYESDTYAEDCDLTLKLLSHNYKVDYESDAISLTEAPEELLPLLKQRYRWTRGILQSIKKHKAMLITPGKGWRVTVTMWQMIFEAILWPLMNIAANVMFIVVAIIFGISDLLVLWWVQLTVLDTFAAIHAIAIEREDLALAPYALVYRLVFCQIVDVAKLSATIEELLGFKMGWGKLERKGAL